MQKDENINLSSQPQQDAVQQPQTQVPQQQAQYQQPVAQPQPQNIQQQPIQSQSKKHTCFSILLGSCIILLIINLIVMGFVAYKVVQIKKQLEKEGIEKVIEKFFKEGYGKQMLEDIIKKGGIVGFPGGFNLSPYSIMGVDIPESVREGKGGKIKVPDGIKIPEDIKFPEGVIVPESVRQGKGGEIIVPEGMDLTEIIEMIGQGSSGDK